MAQQTFDGYLADTLAVAKATRDACDQANAILSRHNANNVGSLTEELFGAGRPLTKTQYDALMITFTNLKLFWEGGNGTNIERALTEYLGPTQ